MGERKQPTPIDADEYEAFVQFVKDVHGGTRGHLRTELENALREYRQSYYNDGSDRLVRVENDVATIKAMLAEGEVDGGEVVPAPDPSDGSTHAHADQNDTPDAPMEKPAANQPREKKARWIAQDVRDRIGNTQAFGKPAIRKIIDDAYGFDDRVADPLLETVIDVLGAEICPVADLEQADPDTIAWGETLDDRWEEREAILEEQAEDDAGDQFDALDDAERGDPMDGD